MSDDTDLSARIAELEADNRRLRRLLEQSNAPGELRHRLRSTLTLLRAIIRRSAETPRPLEDYAGHLEDRLDALARAQSAADQYGAVDLHKLIADELLRYGVSDGDRLTLSGPAVELRPRMGQVLALAVHELAVNAVEHGELGTGGRLTVDWSLAEADAKAPASLVLVWKERDAAPFVAARQGLGSEVLSRMLPYESNAAVTVTSEPDGLRCVIRMPLNTP